MLADLRAQLQIRQPRGTTTMAALKDIGHPLLYFLAVVIVAILGFLKVYWEKLSPLSRTLSAVGVFGLTLLGVGMFASLPRTGTEGPNPENGVPVSINPTFNNTPIIAPTIVVSNTTSPVAIAPPAQSEAAEPAPTALPPKPANPSQPRRAQARVDAPTPAPRGESDSTTISVTGSNPTFINGAGTVIHNHGSPSPTTEAR
jgi:hypothetical protein